LLSEVPTMAESGLREVGIVLWGAVYAPAGTPDEIVQKLSKAYADVVRDPGTAKRLRDMGIVPIGSTPTELDKYWKSEIELYRKIVADAGISLQ
jgi:tripartite-type tricarboxylate transporter receptor subunit TctC